MKVGRMYCFTQRARKLLVKQAKKLNWPEDIPIRIYNTSTTKTYTFDLYIVVLEIHESLFANDWRKIKALLPDGEIGTMNVSMREWREIEYQNEN